MFGDHPGEMPENKSEIVSSICRTFYRKSPEKIVPLYAELSSEIFSKKVQIHNVTFKK